MLMESVTEWFGVFFLIYRCMIAFAVVKVISAVFITETNRVAAADEQIALRQIQHAKEQKLAKLNRIFVELDESEDGYLTWDEFQYHMKDDVMQLWFKQLEIDLEDCKQVWKLHDDGDGRVARDTFVNTLVKLSGHAKNADSVTLLKLVSKMDSKIDLVMKQVQQKQPNSVHIASL
eukprot:gnl/TRDRNA2_/TRDRNA2_167125_c3_seq6.p1 gnl/TRDRNA2_/TRDRNA2_167125_c3~~gnl/TRDRNA2_/TRDRNA2_167125_c3_seq6.p1  ORF type:complete len:176 (+),score=38.86 gnl/TRDRNA2_/TRDRNA2_167125_c3_seq6:21-548(+)